MDFPEEYNDDDLAELQEMNREDSYDDESGDEENKVDRQDND